MELATLTLKNLKALATAWNVTPAGDKRKKQIWVAALEAKREEMTKELAPAMAKTDCALAALKQQTSTEAVEELEIDDSVELHQELALIQEATQGGDRVITLGEWVGHPLYKVLEAQAVQECCEAENFYKSLYNRAVELEMEISPRWHALRNDDRIIGGF